ncbi:MAG: threonylcarbamoyl-AMP synthase [Acidobacteria bacterium]|nr:threonylcarbamoyl-AMP synthase [Acidobacteriota bacterium]
MGTEIIKLDPDQLADAGLSCIAEAVRQGRVIAYPTDTFYGLGCDPFNEAAVERLFAIKQRERDKPILLIISDPTLVVWLTSERNERFKRLSQHFWPGPLTLVLRASERLPSLLTGETGTIGIRLPDHELCRRIVSAAGGVLTGTSANLTGQPSVATAEGVLSQLGESLNLIVDGGPTPGGAPSTVLDLTQDPPWLIREGAVSRRALEEVERFLL